MRIERIVKKGRKDVTIYFDDDKYLILSVEVFLKSGLKKGDNVDEDRFSFLIEQNKLYHIKQKALRLLGRRQHSVFELRTKLWRKDYEQKLIDSVISDLKENKYLNDEDFILEFVAAKSKSKNWSLRRIISELIKRGISSKQIDSALKGQLIDSDKENVAGLAKKKYELLLKRGLDQNELKKRMYSYLLSKGFDYELVKTVCDKIIKSGTDE